VSPARVSELVVVVVVDVAGCDAQLLMRIAAARMRETLRQVFFISEDNSRRIAISQIREPLRSGGNGLIGSPVTYCAR
jgi:hypothetical protein